MNHLSKYKLAYAKGAALLIAQQAAGFAAAVAAISPDQWAAMDHLHRMGFCAAQLGSGAMLLAAFLSQAITAANQPNPPSS